MRLAVRICLEEGRSLWDANVVRHCKSGTTLQKWHWGLMRSMCQGRGTQQAAATHLVSRLAVDPCCDERSHALMVPFFHGSDERRVAVLRSEKQQRGQHITPFTKQRHCAGKKSKWENNM